MVTLYVADGLTACLMNVEEFVAPFQQILMRSQYVAINCNFNLTYNLNNSSMAV